MISVACGRNAAKLLYCGTFCATQVMQDHGRKAQIEAGGKIMYLNRHKQHTISKGHYDHARDRIFYHLRWNILPVAAMLILLGWVSLQAGKMIEESKQSTTESVTLIE